MRARVRWTASILLCLLPVTHGSEPVNSLLEDSPAFDTPEEAVVAALAVAMGRTGEHEYGGAILEWEGLYYYSNPVTSEKKESVKYHVRGPEGVRLVALYHTHPRHEMDDYFSAGDIREAQRTGVKSYLGVAASGRMKVFDPATMQGSRRLGKAKYGELALGRLLTPAPRDGIEAAPLSEGAATARTRGIHCNEVLIGHAGDQEAAETHRPASSSDSTLQPCR